LTAKQGSKDGNVLAGPWHNVLWQQPPVDMRHHDSHSAIQRLYTIKLPL